MDWNSYGGLMSHLKGYVKKTGRLLERIRDMQQEKTIKRSRDLEVFPEGKEMDRLSVEAHKNWTVKRKGQIASKEDLKRFEKDKQNRKPTTIDIVLLIDGSASMTMDGYKVGKAKPMEIALLSSIILYEAAKEVDANVYIALWGNENPIMLAKPGDDRKKIEQNLLKAKKGMSCGTNLAPSIKKITSELAAHKSSGYSGYTHMMVISDGDISDPDESVKAINTLLHASDYTTLEFAVLKKGEEVKTRMEEVADRVKTGNPSQKIGVHRDGDPNSIPAGIVGLIFQKIRTMKSFAAVPWARKRKQFQRASRKHNFD
jgi:Mg-chelatase subunit ChlD